MAIEKYKKKKTASAKDQDPIKQKSSTKSVGESTHTSAKKRKVIENTTQVKVKKIKIHSTKKVESVAKTFPKNFKRSPIKNSEETNTLKNPIPKSNVKIIKTQSNEDCFIGSEESSEVDDQSQSLLTGFEIDEHNSIVSSEDNQAPDLIQQNSKDNGEKQGESSGQERTCEQPGVIYISRIPHGFYEHEMKAYFTQFGNIMNLRLSRNRKTGASKHRAWIKFESASVAEIVAKTMDNYLMFGHLLKIKLLSDDQIPTTLFKGSNKRFKKVPWNKIEGRNLMQPHSREAWQKRIQREEKRRLDKATKLKNLGYEFELPKIKSIKSKT